MNDKQKLALKELYAVMENPEPKPKIIQLIEIDDCFLGLADNGAVYERLGDKWTIFMDPLGS